jgi:hypothetical protein
LSRVQPTRHVPPSGFGYPLDGLLPRVPGRFCFTPAALMGFALRRFHLPGAIATLSVAKNPPAVGHAVDPEPKRQTVRHTPVPGSMSPESALRPCGVLIRRPPAPPLGFAPLGSAGEGLAPDFSRSPLTRFTGSGDYSPNPSASQSINRPSTRFARYRTEVRPGRNHPCGVLAPA